MEKVDYLVLFFKSGHLYVTFFLRIIQVFLLKMWELKYTEKGFRLLLLQIHCEKSEVLPLLSDIVETASRPTTNLIICFFFSFFFDYRASPSPSDKSDSSTKRNPKGLAQSAVDF